MKRLLLALGATGLALGAVVAVPSSASASAVPAGFTATCVNTTATTFTVTVLRNGALLGTGTFDGQCPTGF